MSVETGAAKAERPVCVATFYRFFDFHDYQAWQDRLTQLGNLHQVKGTVLLAPEGLNATIAGPDEGVSTVLAELENDPRMSGLTVKRSRHRQPPFRKLRVRLKREIVTFRQPDVDATQTGTKLAPPEWNRVVDNPNIPVIDTRNDFEVEIGSFQGAINPHTDHFTEFADWAQTHLDPAQTPEVAMFCTGGIRCEKASAWLLQQGFETVYQLDGGILQYLEDTPREETRWQGECFVFDQRVTVDHDLEAGDYLLCGACWQPVSPDARQSPRYVPGISCPRCFSKKTDADRERYAERVKQIELARERGEPHLGQ